MIKLKERSEDTDPTEESVSASSPESIGNGSVGGGKQVSE